MKRLTSVAILAMLYSGAALAQADKPATAPPAGAKVTPGNEGKHARHADARHCLDQKTDLLIIRCAEKYR